jgi:hypothetical protein
MKYTQLSIRLPITLIIFMSFVSAILLTVLNAQPILAQKDNASCNPPGLKTADKRFDISAPSQAKLGSKVKINASINTAVFSNYQQYGSLRLCIKDVKTGNWSEKPANWTIRSGSVQTKYPYEWDTKEAKSHQSTEENPHLIRVIAIPSIIFGANQPQYVAQQSIVLTQDQPKSDETPPPPGGNGELPPPVDGGPGGGSGGGPGSGGGGEEPPPPGNGGGKTSKDPDFGVQAVVNYFKSLTKPQNVVELFVNIINFLLGLIAMAAFIAFIVGGLQYMTSFGNEEKAATGKRTVVYAVTGLIISIALITIITVVSQTIKGQLFK